ncbi:hypothetical protein G6O67_008720 [Ophiocordyceps sinensis]|uniref:Uncharacterized protein n=1 Tax=Ophiocordyceps sinensis TaxID=72228 RepID=A0A8H4LSF7_9HYPO|nr:hypothetical protein G6O67_008720 [Ophiocordyceps sinensis]
MASTIATTSTPSKIPRTAVEDPRALHGSSIYTQARPASVRRQAGFAMDLAAMRAKRRYDGKHRQILLQAGDKVYLKLHRGYHEPSRPVKKWSRQREGPFLVKRMVNDLAAELDLPPQL